MFPHHQQHEKIVDDIDQSWKIFYKISGTSQLMAALSFFIGLVFIFCQTMAIGPAAKRLEILAKQQAIFQLSNVSFILADIFAILGILGIYLSLHKLKKSHALAGATLGILGATLAVGVRFGVFAEVVIANLYVNAASESLQTGYIAAAELIRNATDSGLLIANLLLGVGGLITGVAMLAGVYHKKIAHLFIVTNILYIIGFIGIVFVSAFFPIVLIACFMTIISMALIGLRLYAISNHASTYVVFNEE